MNVERSMMKSRPRIGRRLSFIIHHSAFIISLCLLLSLQGCRQIGSKLNVQPRALRDVPAARLAFRLEPDVGENVLPPSLLSPTPDEPLAPVKQDFDTRRKDEALLRTVASPDGQRALALYDPGGLPSDEFKIDLYAADGRFLRNLLPENLSGAFLTTAVWSPDGQWIAFIGRKTEKPQPTPTPPDELPVPSAPSGDNTNAAATPTVQPLLPPVQMFTTEQVYLCDRDGFNLRPLTTRDGLVYFSLAWAPDGHALVALACTEAELAARINENKMLAGRPRLIDRNGQERLLDDQLMDALPVWSPDAAKVATASDTNVLIYDAIGAQPTGARLALHDQLLTASTAYDAQKLAQGGQVSAVPLSFNPIVRLEWPQPETLLVQTGFVRIYQNNEEVRRYLRWHVLHLSPQAVLLK